MFAPISFTLNPSIVLINVFAFAVGVPVVVSTKSTVLVVADVLIIFAGAIKLPLASTAVHILILLFYRIISSIFVISYVFSSTFSNDTFF